VRLIRLMPIALAIPYAAVPLFPAFIALTTATVPGVSLVPRNLTIALLALMTLLALYAVIMLLRKPVQRPPTMAPLFVWLAAIFIAGVLGFDPAAGMLFIGIFALGVIWHLLVLRYYPQRGVSRAIYWSLVISGGLASLAAIAMVGMRLPANQYALGHGRAIGTFVLPGELAGYLIIFLPVAFVLARRASDASLRIAAWSALVVGVAAFVLTFSRAGWMGLAAAIAFYAFATGTVRRRYAPLILLAGLIAVLALFNAHHNPAENYTRLSIWQTGIEIARRFPLTGVGPFNFARIYPLVRLPDGDPQAFHAHSFLLTTFAETGIAGVLAALAAWWRFIVDLRERLRTAPAGHAAIALAVAAGLVGTWVQGLIDTVSVVIFGLWLPSMALALAAASDGLGDLG
jgi:putative inorganic carbon (HCO3(-)) transporter